LVVGAVHAASRIPAGLVAGVRRMRASPKVVTVDRGFVARIVDSFPLSFASRVAARSFVRGIGCIGNATR